MKTKSASVVVSRSKHPRYAWRVLFPGPDGKRASRFFKSETKAKKFAKDTQREVGFIGSEFGGLTEAERNAVAGWRSVLAEAKATGVPAVGLDELVRTEAHRWRASIAGVSVEAMIEKVVAVKEAENASEGYVSALRSRLNRFAVDHGTRAVSSFTPPEIGAWIKESFNTDGTRKQTRKILSALFTQAVIEGAAASNPVTDSIRFKPKYDGPAGVLKPGQVKAVLDNADARLVPFLAIGFFAGIRVAEIERMDWRMIDLEAAEIHLPGSITKNGHKRTVEILPALDAFLRPHAQESGPVVSMSHSGRAVSVRKAAKAAKVDWPHNAGRHSYATAHLFAFGDAGKTALELGHSGSPQILHAHYKGEMSKTEAKAYWEIRP